MANPCIRDQAALPARWASAVEYLEVFTDDRLVYLPDTGHDVYLDDPAARWWPRYAPS